MSAIAGVYLLNGKSVDQNDLKRMNDSLSYRGPDGSGLWCEGPVGLAHQMLWTTHESLHEKLPLERIGLVITSDARIDNREELLPILGLSEEVSDSKVILEAYRKWGQSCVDNLLGDFAFAIWDKVKKEIFCARDHIGVKPFYYYYYPGKIFAFATEIKALFAWGVPRRINEVRIGDYLMDICEDREITFYQNILRLPSANIMILNPDTLRKERYWELDPTREIKLGSDEEYQKAFRDIFKEAVRCRLRSAFPVGSMLSGGLDSSSIVCMARMLLPKDRPLKTFSVIFDVVKKCDERPYIDAVLEGGDLQAHYIQGDAIGPLTDIERMLWHEDQPIAGPNLFLHWALYKEAHLNGVRILLDGIDGDNAVSYGTTYITELTGNGRLIPMLKEVRDLSRNLGLSSGQILMKFAVYPFIPGSLIQMWRFLHGKKNASEIELRAINPDFAKRVGLADRVKKKTERSRPFKIAKEDHWRMLSWGIHEQMLAEANMAASAFSIEPRNPFYDKRLLEFCLALPPDQKIRGGWTRWILRRSLEDILPEKVFCRAGKTLISSNFLHGLTTFHRGVLESTVFDEQGSLNEYANRSFLRESFRQLKDSEERSAKDDDIAVWQAAVLGLWLRIEIEDRHLFMLL